MSADTLSEQTGAVSSTHLTSSVLAASMDIKLLFILFVLTVNFEPRYFRAIKAAFLVSLREFQLFRRVSLIKENKVYHQLKMTFVKCW